MTKNKALKATFNALSVFLRFNRVSEDFYLSIEIRSGALQLERRDVDACSLTSGGGNLLQLWSLRNVVDQLSSINVGRASSDLERSRSVSKNQLSATSLEVSKGCCAVGYFGDQSSRWLAITRYELVVLLVTRMVESCLLPPLPPANTGAERRVIAKTANNRARIIIHL